MNVSVTISAPGEEQGGLELLGREPATAVPGTLDPESAAAIRKAVGRTPTGPEGGGGAPDP